MLVDHRARESKQLQHKLAFKTELLNNLLQSYCLTSILNEAHPKMNVYLYNMDRLSSTSQTNIAVANEKKN